MPRATGPGSRPRQVYEQPQEGLPRRKFDLEIRRLEQLQEAIEVARSEYRAQPSPQNESKLQKLIDKGDALRFDIGFGIAP